MISEPIKFLLVDDTEENLVALEALLRRDGLQILRARSGSEALELLLVHEVALAFLDVQMPEMDGFELAELMRGAERTKHVPIIFVTAGASDPQRVFKGYETGAVDFLFKPIEPHTLRNKADAFFELSRQRRECSDALRLNELFVGILGHDLRNPLNAILMGTQLLEHQLEDEGQVRVLRRMASAGQRMTSMIEQLLDLTRARLGDGLGFLRVRKPLDVAELVQRTAEELHGIHPGREVVVDAHCDSTATGDPERLLQLFSNLIANALHHGTSGAAVSVTVDGSDTDVVVRVQNRGAIPAEHIATLFDPFRARQRAPSKSGGLGLGLFICQQIAIAHGGSLLVESSEHAGTLFTARIPRRSMGREHANQRGSSRTVLIVEDDQDTRDSLREAFEQEGYHVESATNGGEALDFLIRGARRPHVVILDLMMPVMDGSRVYEAMQADSVLSKIPVIMSTSMPARAPTWVTVLPKPLKLDRLLAFVAELWLRDP